MAGLVTGEAVPLDVRPARLPSRLLAALLDGLVLLVLLLGGAFLLSRVPLDVDPAAGAAAGTVLFVAVVVGYPTLWEVLTRGRTPGKAALGLRVVRDDGGPVRFRHSFTRALTLLVDVPTLFVPSLVAQLGTERGKRLGDLLAGTFVVQERVPATGSTVVIVMPPPLAGWAATLDLSRLGDDLALTVRQFLVRAPQLRPEAREDLGLRLAAAVAAATTPPPPPGTPGWAYLAAVLAERRRRAEQKVVPRGATALAPPAPPPVPSVPAEHGTASEAGAGIPTYRPTASGTASTGGWALPGAD